MKKRWSLVLLAAIVSSSLAIAASGDKAPPASATVGSKEKAKWSATTLEAAERNREFKKNDFTWRRGAINGVFFFANRPIFNCSAVDVLAR